MHTEVITLVTNFIAQWISYIRRHTKPTSVMNKPGYIRTAAGQVSLVHSLLSFLPARIYSLKIFGRPLGLYSSMEKKGHKVDSMSGGLIDWLTKLFPSYESCETQILGLVYGECHLAITVKNLLADIVPLPNICYGHIFETEPVPQAHSRE